MPDSLVAQIDEVRGNVARSKLLRVMAAEWLKEHDEAPRWLKKTNQRDKLIEENNPIASAANFKQRTWEHTKRLLVDEDGGRKPFAPEPDKYKRAYIQSWLKEIHKVIPYMWQGEYMEHLAHLQQYYSTVHPHGETSTPDRVGELKQQMAVHIKRGNTELAFEMAETADRQGTLPPEKAPETLMSEAKDLSKKQWSELAEA